MFKRVSFIILAILISCISLYAIEQGGASEQNSTKIDKINSRISSLTQNIDEIDKSLKNNYWYTKYKNHQTFIKLANELKQAKSKLKKLTRYKQSSKKEQISALNNKILTLENQIELLSDSKAQPFKELTKPSDLKAPPKVTSPFGIFEGLAYIKYLKDLKTNYSHDLDLLYALLKELQDRLILLEKLYALVPNKINKKRVIEQKSELDEMQSAYDVAATTHDIFIKKIDNASLKTTNDIKEQTMRLFYIAIAIIVVILLSFVFKYLAKKTITDNERYYMANKIINFSNLIIISLILLFSFLENATYLATVVGFASAGIAIAMKDLFMSSLGWMVIVFGGSFHVGDRVKVTKGGHEYVGDIVDISFLRMTILEDVTLTTYDVNRRAGRIIFIPNNYIFTELIANYTHGKIKTVWDGVDVTITFDSNYQKAKYQIKEIVKKFSKGYTEISRKQLNKLRSQYSLKNINVEPKIYTFLEPNGIKISCWYMTNSYATLTLRSNIFASIIDMINEEDDIKIAYPTQTINYKKDKELPIIKREKSSDESLS